jgi:hypothetical protein
MLRGGAGRPAPAPTAVSPHRPARMRPKTHAPTHHPLPLPTTRHIEALLENIFRSVNIALVNELAMLTDRMGIDIWEVLDAASTKPYGFMRFEPGPGMGGHCLPVDPFYLSWRAREFDMTTEFIELASKINQQMPYHCAAKVQRALGDAGHPVKGSRIALLGVSYKPGVGDIRESPALKILTLLSALGADLRYHDPHVPRLRPVEHPLGGGLARRRPRLDRHRPPWRRPPHGAHARTPRRGPTRHHTRFAGRERRAVVGNRGARLTAASDGDPWSNPDRIGLRQRVSEPGPHTKLSRRGKDAPPPRASVPATGRADAPQDTRPRRRHAPAPDHTPHRSAPALKSRSAHVVSLCAHGCGGSTAWFHARRAQHACSIAGSPFFCHMSL